MTKPWYQIWFGEAYKTLYPHRDSAQAQRQVEFLAAATAAQKEWTILDLGCGSGRHLDAWRNLGYGYPKESQLLGADLSTTLLKDARAKGHNVFRCDLRHISLPANSVNLLASFFTSFGYFATLAEDLEALVGFARIVKPGGYLFLDLPDRQQVIESLVARDEQILNGHNVIQERKLEGDQVVKTIRLQSQSGEEQKFEERIRLFSRELIESAANDLDLLLADSFGDENGSPWISGQSPRMSLLFQKLNSSRLF